MPTILKEQNDLQLLLKITVNKSFKPYPVKRGTWVGSGFPPFAGDLSKMQDLLFVMDNP